MGAIADMIQGAQGGKVGRIPIDLKKALAWFKAEKVNYFVYLGYIPELDTDEKIAKLCRKLNVKLLKAYKLEVQTEAAEKNEAQMLQILDKKQDRLKMLTQHAMDNDVSIEEDIKAFQALERQPVTAVAITPAAPARAAPSPVVAEPIKVLTPALPPPRLKSTQSIAEIRSPSPRPSPAPPARDDSRHARRFRPAEAQIFFFAFETKSI